MGIETVALRLDEKRLMKQGKSLHRSHIVGSSRREAMRHLQEFGIGGFKIADRFAAKLLIADPGDARNNPVARFGGNLRQGTERIGFEGRRRLRGQQSIEHPERRKELLAFFAFPCPFHRHVQQLRIVPIKILSDVGHADIRPKIVEFARDPLPRRIGDARQHAHQFILNHQEFNVGPRHPQATGRQSAELATTRDYMVGWRRYGKFFFTPARFMAQPPTEAFAVLESIEAAVAMHLTLRSADLRNCCDLRNC